MVRKKSGTWKFFAAFTNLNKILQTQKLLKDPPLEGDESSIIVVTGGRPGPSSHCSLSNHQFKIKQQNQWVY